MPTTQYISIIMGLGKERLSGYKRLEIGPHGFQSRLNISIFSSSSRPGKNNR